MDIPNPLNSNRMTPKERLTEVTLAYGSTR